METLFQWLTLEKIVIILLCVTLCSLIIINFTGMKELRVSKFKMLFGRTKTISRNFYEHGIFASLFAGTESLTDEDCPSKDKRTYLEAFMKIYDKALDEELHGYVASVLKSNGETLSSIDTVFDNVEMTYIDKSRGVQVQIWRNGKRYILEGIPTILVDKFKRRCNLIQKTLDAQIGRILTDKIHITWQEKLLAILDIIEAKYNLNFKTNLVIKDLNGEIDREVDAHIKRLI